MKKKRHAHLEQRRKDLVSDNEKEDRVIKKLNRKLGLDRRKPRKSGVEKQPAWMRESGLDYLLNFEKHSDAATNDSLGETTLGLQKKRSKTESDIYGQDSDAEMDSEQELSGILGSDGEVVDLSEGCEELDDDAADIELHGAGEDAQSKINDDTEGKEDEEEDVQTLRRGVRRLLNCVSESQMAKTTGDLVNLFKDRPRAIVRRILIEEMDILLGSFPLGRGQAVGWLQQELAACFVSCQAHLDHGGLSNSRLVAHIAEFLVSRLPTPTTNLATLKDGGILTSRSVFIAYLYRFGGLTGDLVMDLVEEFVKSNNLAAMQAAHQIVKPVSSVLRKEQMNRCTQLVNLVKTYLAELEESDYEKKLELEGICSNLTAKHAKEPALSSADHFVKVLRTWNKGISISKESRLPLRLDQLRNTKAGGRWWAVGSAFHGDALLGDPSQVSQPARTRSTGGPNLSPELLAVATQLGLITPMRQQLFGVLMTTAGGPDSTANALVQTCGRQGTSDKSSSVEHREREMVQIVMHCLVSEQPFNRFYTRVLGGLLNNHRRFGIMVRCAFWDVMTKEELTKDAKMNAGKAVGILAAVYDFPLTLLKKFNFGDESEANVAFLTSLIHELTTIAFKTTLEKFAFVANISPKLGRNLRILMRRMSKTHPEEACRAYLGKLVAELRDLFP